VNQVFHQSSNSLVVVRPNKNTMFFDGEWEATMHFARQATADDLLQVLGERVDSFKGDAALVALLKGVYKRIISEAVAAALTP
jgi:hypothetical protein